MFALLLQHYSLELKLMLETDTLDRVIAGILL
jgi:hypothetical protein